MLHHPGRAMVILVLAAGRSRRFGPRNKLLADLHGRPVLSATLASARASRAGRIVVVTGADRIAVEHAVASAADELGLGDVLCVHNERHEEGMGTSIASGVRATAGAMGWLIWPGDMPHVAPSTVQAIVAALQEDRPVVPVFSGRRGHPVLFPASFGSRLAVLAGARGGRALLTGAADLATDDPGVLLDIDRPEDLSGRRPHPASPAPDDR